MDICLVRHAEPDWMPGGRHCGDPELSQRGQEQAMRLAVYARDWLSVDEVWISPAIRSQQTAAPLVERLGAPARTLDWLLEAQPSNLDGLTQSEIRERLGGLRGRPVDEWWEGMPDGESLRDFTERVTTGLTETLGVLGAKRFDEAPHWRDVPRESRVVIVSHAGTSGTALAHLLGLAPVPWSWARFRLGHAAMAVVRSRRMSTGQIFALDRFNHREHLPADMHTY